MADYLAWSLRADIDQPVGQCFVKESWREGHADEPELFVMMKVEAHDLTDQGWIYGAIDPRRQRVLEAGKLSTCMRCHARAPRDRIIEPDVPPETAVTPRTSETSRRPPPASPSAR